MSALRIKPSSYHQNQRRWSVGLVVVVLVTSGLCYWFPWENTKAIRATHDSGEQEGQEDPFQDRDLQVAQIASYPNVTRVMFQEAPWNGDAGQNRSGATPRPVRAGAYPSTGSLPFGYPASQPSVPAGQPDSRPTAMPGPGVRSAGFDAGVSLRPGTPIRQVFGYQETGRPSEPQRLPAEPRPTGPHSTLAPGPISPEATYQIGADYNFECAPHGDPGFGYPGSGAAVKSILAVDGFRRQAYREPRWSDAELLPWESLAYGEYIGPARTPHMREYRVRVGDQLDFTYRQTRDIIQQPYRLGVGDVISITANGEYQTDFGDDNLIVLRDGTIQVKSLGSVLVANKTLERLQEELNHLAVDVGPAQESPNIIIKVLKSETELNDLIRTVDATAGQGGQFRSLTVSPDGTVQLPALGSVPAIGLTLDELGAEANARYAMMVQGLEVTPSLRQPAPSFAYVLGEANNPGRIQIQGPTTVMQLVAQAGGWRKGANLREIVVFRRDENWQLIATKLDLSAPLWGNRPHPSDDLWIRNNDIILLPKTPAQRVVDFIEIYFTRGLYGVLPSQGFSVNFDGVSSL